MLQEELDESVALVTRGLEQNWLLPIIGSKYTMEEVSTAHKDIIENSGAKGKMILLI